MPEPRNLKNHTRVVHAYVVALLLLLINLAWAIWRLATVPGGSAVEAVVLAVAVLLIGIHARRFALSVQDRLIRLEMRLRLEALLAPEQRARIGELSLDQLIALRFASDAELPALTALQERLATRREIKALVRDWQADNLRV